MSAEEIIARIKPRGAREACVLCQAEQEARALREREGSGREKAVAEGLAVEAALSGQPIPLCDHHRPMGKAYAGWADSREKA